MISLRTHQDWAPHSPDLNPLDSFSWGAAKNNVYSQKARDLGQLKAEVEAFAASVRVDTCKTVVQNFGV
jgi:hypothetical protein